MLSDRLIKSLQLRVKMLSLFFTSHFEWDEEKGQLKKAGTYQFINMCMGFSGGILFCMFYGIQIVLKLSKDEIPEEGVGNNLSGNKLDFATLIIDWAELLLVLCVSLLNLNTIKKRDLHFYMMNEMLKHNKKLNDMEKRGLYTLTPQNKSLRFWVEAQLYVMFWATAVLPVGIALAMTHPLEATNALLHDWFEIEFRFNTEPLNLVIIIFLSQGMYLGGNIVCTFTIPIIFFYLTSAICVNGFTPTEVRRREGSRCILQTRNYGDLSDLEVIEHYRTQQMFNTLMAEFFKSLLISFHHTAILVTECVLLTFWIRFSHVIEESGVGGYLVIGYCFILPLYIIYAQSKMCGKVVDTSIEFKDASRKIVPRRFMYRKFVASCQIFAIHVVHPFYIVHKETLLMFLEQVTDKTWTLLLW